MKSYIIDRSRIYPKQKIRSYCAMYSVQSIVEHFTSTRLPVSSYASNILRRWTGLSFPGGLEKVLRRYGLSYKIKSYRYLTYKEKLLLLQKSLQEGYPIVLLIAPGYGEKFSYWKALFLQHYVTLWGYDDDKKVFYVYDSGKNIVHDTNIPVGTIAVDYDIFMHHRNWGGFGLYKNLAIQIDRD